MELPLENGDGDGGSPECELASRSSMETSAETASEIEVDDESRYGDGLKGGKESSENNDGCDKDCE